MNVGSNPMFTFTFPASGFRMRGGGERVRQLRTDSLTVLVNTVVVVRDVSNVGGTTLFPADDPEVVEDRFLVVVIIVFVFIIIVYLVEVLDDHPSKIFRWGGSCTCNQLEDVVPDHEMVWVLLEYVFFVLCCFQSVKVIG
jgi:hypothetical protein